VLIDGLAERNIEAPLGGQYTKAVLAEVDRLRDLADDYMNDLATKIRERDAALASLAEEREQTALRDAVVEAAQVWRSYRNFKYRPGEINPHLLSAHQEDLDLAQTIDAWAEGGGR